jgi:adenylate kinase family enzyme
MKKRVKGYKRIFILGGSGSGKTTLAKRLSKELKIPFYTTDFIVFKKDWSSKLPEIIRDQKLKKIISKKKWIIEGKHTGEWTVPALEKADNIIILDAKRLKVFKRIIVRYFKRIGSKNPDRLRDIPKLLYKAHIYKKNNLKEAMEKIEKLKKHCIILKDEKEINEAVKNLK